MDLALLRGDMLFGDGALGGLLAQAVEVGGYVSIWKSVVVVLILLPWARLLSWADKDAVHAHLPRIALNSILLGGLIVALFLFLLVPGFWLGLLVLLVILGGEISAYLGLRSKAVGLGDLKKQFNDWLGGLTKRDGKTGSATAGQVALYDRKGQAMAVPEAEAPNRLAYDVTQSILTGALQKNAEQIDCVPERDAAAVKYYVDGVGYTSASISKQELALATEYLKLAAGLDFAERRKPQEGTLKASVDGRKIELTLQTAGSASGEVIRLLADVKKLHQQRLGDLGLTSDQLQALTTTVQEPGGVVIVSAPKDHGLTTMFYAILREHDAFLTHIQTLEHSPDQDLEGITQNKLPHGTNPSEETRQTEWVISQEVDVLGISRVEATETAQALAKYAGGRTNKRVYVGMRASSTFEAIARWRKLVGDDKLAMASLRMVINGRVLRKLCSACKVPFTPDASMLRKLNLNSEVSQLYQARSEPLRNEKGEPIPCNFCHDLRYKGRVGFYELLTVNDRIREVILTGGSNEQLKAAFRKQRGQYLQESALKLVEAGETSIQEVLRVLKPVGG